MRALHGRRSARGARPLGRRCTYHVRNFLILGPPSPLYHCFATLTRTVAMCSWVPSSPPSSDVICRCPFGDYCAIASLAARMSEGGILHASGMLQKRGKLFHISRAPRRSEHLGNARRSERARTVTLRSKDTSSSCPHASCDQLISPQQIEGQIKEDRHIQIQPHALFQTLLSCDEK